MDMVGSVGRSWTGPTLILAGVYNIIWGSFVVLFPAALFSWARMDPPRYPQIWQCVGMMVGVFGLGYLISAGNPARYWPLILVGLLGKIFGPMGFLFEAAQGRLPWRAGWVIVTNDLIWWIPFALILRDCLKRDCGSSDKACSRPGNMGIFPRVLGPAWNEIHQAIREFHAGESPTHASGLFDIQRGGGRAAKILASVFGLPPSGSRVPTLLEIRPHAGGETWRRMFRDHLISSELAEDRDCIIERFPGGEFRLQVSAGSEGMMIRSARFSLRLGPLRVPLPDWIAPRVNASIKPSDSERLSVSVDLSAPGIGLVLAYQGNVQKETK